MAAQDPLDIPAFPSFTEKWHNKPYASIDPSRPELSATGKNVVVTGGGTGIGKAIATAFAQAGAASVSILGRRSAQLESSARDITAASTNKKTRVITQTADLTKRTDVIKALNAITDQVGKIGIFVSNAGTLPEPGMLGSYDADVFMAGFELNVRSAFNAVQAFLPLATLDAVLISISTGIAHIAPMPGVSAYAASKAANLKMMDYFAAENPGLHVVNVQPGVVATEMSQKAGAPAQDEVELPGQFCVWLASDEAKFLKSKFVWVNWDVDELKARSEEIEKSRLFTWYLEGMPL